MRKTLIKIQWPPRKCQENYMVGFLFFYIKKTEMSCVMRSVSASVHVDDEMGVEHEVVQIKMWQVERYGNCPRMSEKS